VESDSQTREAALRTLVESLLRGRSKVMDGSTAEVAEQYGRCSRFPRAEQRGHAGRGPTTVARILLAADHRPGRRFRATCASNGREGSVGPICTTWRERHALCLKQRDSTARGAAKRPYDVSRAKGMEEGRLRALANMARA